MQTTTRELKKRTQITKENAVLIARLLNSMATHEEISKITQISVAAIKKFSQKQRETDEEFLNTFKTQSEKRKEYKKDVNVILGKIESILITDPSLTQKSVQIKLLEENIRISQQTVSRLIKKLDFTSKRL
jgi:transposase